MLFIKTLKGNYIPFHAISRFYYDKMEGNEALGYEDGWYIYVDHSRKDGEFPVPVEYLADVSDNQEAQDHLDFYMATIQEQSIRAELKKREGDDDYPN